MMMSLDQMDLFLCLFHTVAVITGRHQTLFVLSNCFQAKSVHNPTLALKLGMTTELNSNVDSP